MFIINIYNKDEVLKMLNDKEKSEVWHNILEIENSISKSNYLYKLFDDIKNMLYSEKSYIKMRSFRILCKLSKWDNDNKINIIIDDILTILDDKKPTIVRMCLQTINDLIMYKPELSDKIYNKLKVLNISQYKDSMQPLIKKDIEKILLKNK